MKKEKMVGDVEMTKKEKFIEEIGSLMKEAQACSEITFEGLSSDAMDFWNSLMATEKTTVKFTENGKLILKYMQENETLNNNLFKAKEVGEGLNISSRTASGAIRKLVNDGYVEKLGSNPVVYSLTTLGKETNPDDFDTV